MSKNKPRWKDLPFEERIAKELVRAGLKAELANKWKANYKERHKKEERRR